MMHGTELDKPCPKCKGLVIYNGVYFCANPEREHTYGTGGKYTHVGCGWSLEGSGPRVTPWLAAVIRARRALGWDTAWEEQYLPKNHELRTTS